ncbi:MAG: glycosyltransferase family 39 protein [Gemmataceae bacterium]|nr:glycosyltransferase family 39 protein [Gemmataceae bacterium]
MPTVPLSLDLRRPHVRHLAVLAVLFTLLNAVKPLQIDDSAYYCFARQISQDPLHPYGFDMFWYTWPHPANEILAPPLLPYWWSIALHLFGDHTFLSKLWLAPFSILFVWSLDALFRRFARGLETPLLWMTVLSPTFLPSLNLMLDVPALALALTGIVVFFRAAARDSLLLAVGAGIFAGLAAQTKYTGFLAPAVILLYGLMFRRILVGAAAFAVAALLFVSWELFIIQQHGQSHFLYHLHDSDWIVREHHPNAAGLEYIWVRIVAKADNAGPLLTILGAICPPLILLNLIALGVRRSYAIAAGIILALGFVCVAVMDERFFIELTAMQSYLDREPAVSGLLTIDHLVYGFYGLLTLGTAGCVLWYLCVRGEDEEYSVVLAESLETSVGAPLLTVEAESSWRWLLSPFRRIDYFLIVWLLLEVMGYFALTPFPAVRRVFGVVVVGTLLAGRLASRRCRSAEQRRLVWLAGALSIGLGLLFWSVDTNDAYAEKRAAEDAAEFIRAREPDATIWYVGHWGFQHYAERAGMIPVIPGGIQRVEGSRLRKGDWFVKPDWRLNQQMVRVSKWHTEPVEDRVTADHLPLRTVQGYYGGRIPLEHHSGPRVTVSIFRVTEDWSPWVETWE